LFSVLTPYTYSIPLNSLHWWFTGNLMFTVAKWIFIGNRSTISIGEHMFDRCQISHIRGWITTLAGFTGRVSGACQKKFMEPLKLV